MRRDPLQERALDLGAGGVGGVDHAARGVPALPREVEVAVLLVEAGAALDQLADAVGPLARADLGDHLVAEAGARRRACPCAWASGVSSAAKTAAMPPCA